MTQRNLINTPIAREKIPVIQINPSGAVTFAVKNDRDRR